ncbi:MAG TPA: amidohydrolase, partial [Flavisolibacter sp.]|nr:amidohydrolase [Flavisolibacter sp.]
MRRLKQLLMAGGLLCSTILLHAQTTFPVNGVADERTGYYAFTNANIVKDAATTLSGATMIVKQGKIIAIGTNLKVPVGAVEFDCKGKFIYPSFIDIYSDYGIPAAAPRQGGGFNFLQPSQITSNTKGAYNWNQAIKSESDAFRVLASDDAKAKPMREAGFGTVLTHIKDGIARG